MGGGGGVRRSPIQTSRWDKGRQSHRTLSPEIEEEPATQKGMRSQTVTSVGRTTARFQKKGTRSTQNIKYPIDSRFQFSRTV